MEEITTKKNRTKKIVIVLGILILITASSIFLFEKLRVNKAVKEFDLYSAEMEFIFPITEYNNIVGDFRQSIYTIFKDNGFIDDNTYFFTKIPDRAKKVIAYGNFADDPNGDDESAIAFIVEKNDFKSSSLFIVSNTTNILFHKNYDEELPTITSFRKGAKIFMEESKLVSSPSDGILIYFKHKKLVLVYNPKTKSFEEYHQYTNEEIKDLNFNEENDVSNEIESESIQNDTIISG